MSKIVIPRITFVAGDARLDLLARLVESRLRPIYGPEDADGGRLLVGALYVEHVELFAETIARADEVTAAPSEVE